MVLLRYLSTVIGAVLIATGAAQGEDVKKAVGDRVSFRPDKLPDVPSVTSVIWKHKNTSGTIVKAIEWDEGEILTPNPRFKDITTVDEKTGEITITNLKYEHSGVYFFEINSKEQQQRFTLTVMDGVPTPKIKKELIDNSDVVYLRCEYSEPIIWKNSAGDILTGSPVTPKGESITVKKTGNPETFYTCTLKNAVSEKTSDPVYEKDLFNADSNAAAIVGAIFGVILCIIVITIVLYLLVEPVNNFVNTLCPCIIGSFLDRFPNKNDTKGQSTSAQSTGNTDDDTKGQNTGLLTIDITADTEGQSTPADSNADTEGQSTPADSNGTGVKDDSKDVAQQQ